MKNKQSWDLPKMTMDDCKGDQVPLIVGPSASERAKGRKNCCRTFLFIILACCGTIAVGMSVVAVLYNVRDHITLSGKVAELSALQNETVQEVESSFIEQMKDHRIRENKTRIGDVDELRAELMEKIEDVTRELQRLQAVHHNFNRFWNHLLEKIAAEERTTLPPYAEYDSLEVEPSGTPPHHPGESATEEMLTSQVNFDFEGYIGEETGELPSPESVIKLLACRQGPIGNQGVTGLDGLNGQKGDMGLSGLNGVDGEKGQQGIVGSPGIPGMKGTTGLKGEEGVRGLNGLDGPSGFKGAPGLKGEQGDQGTAGEKGDRGAIGLQGVPGARGEPGQQGRDGADVIIPDLFPSDVIAAVINTTLSATFVAMEQGGLRGMSGWNGTDGTSGFNGTDGLKGEAGTNGVDGMSGLDGRNGGDGAPGRTGPNGQKGSAGAPGLSATRAVNLMKSYHRSTFEDNGIFYTLDRRSKTWVSALADCVSKGGFLAGFSSYRQYSSFINKLREGQGWGNIPDRIWIGGYKIGYSFRRVEQSRNNAVGSMEGSWAGREPSGDGYCMEMTKSSFLKFNDNSCSRSHAFLCANRIE